MKNTGKPFELLTQQVFSRLHEHDGFCTEVKHDQQLRGKSGLAHQIDVSFTLRAAGIDYMTIVQCKDWGSAVKQEQVFAFKTVLDDIPGQPRGIIVSRSGFQEGARTFAAAHGIKLYELREPHDEDWDGLLRRIHTTLNVFFPDFTEVSVCPDDAWIGQEMKTRALAPVDFDVSVDLGRVGPLLMESGAECDLAAILNSYARNEEMEAFAIHHEFPERVFLPTPEGPLEFIAINSISATLRIRKLTRDIVVSIDHLIAYCFRDVLQQNSQFLDTQCAPIGPKKA